MSDPLCVGVCMIDWDAGVCLGCGRTTDEIDGVTLPPSPPDTAPELVAAPLPANVAAQVGEGSD